MTSHRVFFALWPDDRQRTAIEAARNRLFPLSGRPVEPGNLHVTLAFIGNVASDRVAQLAALCGPVPAFTIELDRLEHWSKPRVLVAAATHAPRELLQLVDGLWRRLDRLGFARETRPYRPHLTLARDVRSLRAGMAWAPVAWRVERLVLVESGPTPQGVRYVPLAPPV
jgi:RNA 2',3'-cyclic 3'-phosphodiesterase